MAVGCSHRSQDQSPSPHHRYTTNFPAFAANAVIYSLEFSIGTSNPLSTGYVNNLAATAGGTPYKWAWVFEPAPGTSGYAAQPAFGAGAPA